MKNRERKSAEAARNFLEEEAKKAAEVEAKKAAEEEARKAEEELEKRKEELRKKLQVRADEVVAEELQRRGMEKRSEDLLEMQQVAETRRRNQLKGRARGSKPSSSSSESTGEEEKAVEGKKKDEEMVDESNAAKGPEQEDEQMAEESKAAKEPEQEDKQMAEESEAAKDLEQEDESMSMAEAIRASYKITDETIASLLEEDKMPSIRSVMLTLEDSIQDLPTAYGAKMEKLADEFTEWTGQLQDAADRAEEDLEENGAKKDSTRNMRDLALVKKAEAEMKKVEADAEIAEADEMLKTIMIEAENLQAGKKTVRETLDSSQRISIMLKDTVEQMKSVTAENVELRSRLFQEPKKEKNPQLAMLKAMMRKRKLAGGSMTPMSGVSPSETEEGGERKKVRGSDKPSEPKLPPKVKPEPKSAPDVLKDKDRKEREAESPAGKDEKAGTKRRVNPKWMLDSAESSQFGCFFCVAQTHKAKDCPSMWELVRLRKVPTPSATMRQQQRADLFCQAGYDEGRGYDLLPENSSDRKTVRFYGFNAHTYQKCYSYNKMGSSQRQKYDDEVEKIIKGQSQPGGRIPNPKWREEKASRRAKAIAVGDDDGKKDERAGEPKEKKEKPSIFTAPVALPKEPIAANSPGEKA